MYNFTNWANKIKLKKSKNFFSNIQELFLEMDNDYIRQLVHLNLGFPALQVRQFFLRYQANPHLQEVPLVRVIRALLLYLKIYCYKKVFFLKFIYIPGEPLGPTSPLIPITPGSPAGPIFSSKMPDRPGSPERPGSPGVPGGPCGPTSPGSPLRPPSESSPKFLLY